MVSKAKGRVAHPRSSVLLRGWQAGWRTVPPTGRETARSQATTFRSESRSLLPFSLTGTDAHAQRFIFPKQPLDACLGREHTWQGSYCVLSFRRARSCVLWETVLKLPSLPVNPPRQIPFYPKKTAKIHIELGPHYTVRVICSEVFKFFEPHPPL